MFNKKGRIAIFSFLIAFCLLAGCASSAPADNPPAPTSDTQAVEHPASAEKSPVEKPVESRDFVRVGILKGPSSLGMLEMMEKNLQGLSENEYDFTVAGVPQDVGAKLLNNELDIAAIPINLAATLYNKTDKKIKTIAVGTLGVLYILSRDESVTGFASLAGKTVYATAQGATPEYVLNYLLDKNGLTGETEVEFKGEHAELATLISTGGADIAMLPQPFVTTVTSKNPDIKIALDLNEEWRRISGTELAMTCIVVRGGFLEENKDAVDAFLREYEQSANFVNENLDEAAALSEKFDIIPEAVAKQAIPKCNIVFIGGDDMKPSANPVLEVLLDANPQSVGGALPDDAFYYAK